MWEDSSSGANPTFQKDFVDCSKGRFAAFRGRRVGLFFLFCEERLREQVVRLGSCAPSYGRSAPHGGIREIGSHDELMALQGRYYRMWQAQAQYYQEDQKMHDYLRERQQA